MLLTGLPPKISKEILDIMLPVIARFRQVAYLDSKVRLEKIREMYIEIFNRLHITYPRQYPTVQMSLDVKEEAFGCFLFTLLNDYEVVEFCLCNVLGEISNEEWALDIHFAYVHLYEAIMRAAHTSRSYSCEKRPQ